MKIGPREFKHIIGLDFEFHAPPGENPKPICLVTRDLTTGATNRYWIDELLQLKEAPYPTGDDAISVAYYASAELNCFLALGWPFPKFMLDLFSEYRCLTNNRNESGHSLLSALAWFGLDGIGSAEKEEMRALAIRGGPFTEQEKHDLLDYCESDVISLQRLAPKMIPLIDFPRAFIRGKYMGAAARIETNGIPVDHESLIEIEENWPEIQSRLIQKVDSQYRVFDGLSFKYDLFSKYLLEHKIPWPLLPSGRLDLKEQTFEEMSRAFRQLSRLHELRAALAQMRSGRLPVGSDSRNRTLLSPFRSVTGRNQPKSTNFIFGRSAWFRYLIQPKPLTALAYVDWSQQEFGIAGALSRDPAMIAAYASGDPYLKFGQQAGAIPHDGTKQSHKVQREQFKQCALAVLYGGGASLVATRTGLSQFEAKQLIAAHKKSYPIFWKWIGTAVDCVNLGGELKTVFGWRYAYGPKTKHGTILNFPMQANGADMMRLAAIKLTESGIRVCAPVHDAFLVEATIQEIDEVVRQTQDIMADASRLVLGSELTLRSDAKIFSYPERYADERGDELWNKIQSILEEFRLTKATHESASIPRTDTQNLIHASAPPSSLNLYSLIGDPYGER